MSIPTAAVDGVPDPLPTLSLYPDTKLKRGDVLVLEGDEADFRKRDVEPYMEFLADPVWTESDLESRSVEVVEAMLTPRSGLIGKTLKETHFREKYGLSVLAIWRGSDEIVRDLGELPLGFGDALLLQGYAESFRCFQMIRT